MTTVISIQLTYINFIVISGPFFASYTLWPKIAEEIFQLHLHLHADD